MSRIIKVAGPAVCACALLTACSVGDAIGVASQIAGAGEQPTVEANLQAGRDNDRNIGVTNRRSQDISDAEIETVEQMADQSTRSDQSVKNSTVEKIEQSAGKTSVRSERVDQAYFNQKDSPWIIIVLMAMTASATAGILLPQPSFMRRKKSAG